MIEHKTIESPLAVFTVALQASCAVALALLWCDSTGHAWQAISLRPIGIVIFPVLASGVIVSLLHLGRPFGAWRALRNLRTSRLSREAFLTGAFAAAALAYTLAWAVGADKYRVPIGAATALLGLAAVVASAWLYMIPGRPFWRSAWLPISFVGTTVVQAAVILVMLTSNKSGWRFCDTATLAGSALLAIAAFVMMKRFADVRRMASASVQPDEPAARARAWHFGALALYLLLAAGLPSAVTMVLWSGRDVIGFSVPSAAVVIAMIVAGNFCGRILMYSLPAAHS